MRERAVDDVPGELNHEYTARLVEGPRDGRAIKVGRLRAHLVPWPADKLPGGITAMRDPGVQVRNMCKGPTRAYKGLAYH